MDEKILASTSPTLTSISEKYSDVEAQNGIERPGKSPLKSLKYSLTLSKGRRGYLSRLWPSSKQEEVNEREIEEINAEKEMAAINTRVLEDCPNGYPRLASFLSSESNFALFRGFGYLHVRVLLEKQYELSKLEQELDDLDEIDDSPEVKGNRLMNRDLDKRRARNDGYRSRSDILDDIHKKILEYDELLLKARDTFALQKPSSRDYRSVRTWFWNLKPLTSTQASFIKKKEDIITLRSGREWSEFDGFIESFLRKWDFFGWNKVSKEHT
jgi:hypothetical protein